MDSPLVGRAHERTQLDAAVAALAGGAGGLVLLRGEPGIGKSRLLAYLAGQAGEAGADVLAARASEFEADLPYALFGEALGDRPGAVPATGADRHRTHRALRDTLARRAAARSLVLALDDVHWADPASADALAALVRRPPDGAVLVALGARTGALPQGLAAALDGAIAEARALVLDLAPLSEAEAAVLVGDGAAAVYARAGGNPFYLEQLARAGAAGPAVAVADDAIPAPVAAALAAELAALGEDARRLLQGAAVAGDPFAAELAAAVADLPEERALPALDELLGRTLVRPARGPRRFAFRHPVVRHAVYVGTPGGWRLGAHARAARELERRGAGPVERAHHVEQAAARGDAAAAALLAEAAARLRATAPGRAAELLAAALALLPDAHADRATLPARLADAQAASGDAAGARETLLAAQAEAPPEERLALTVGLANQEWWLGEDDAARARLQVALSDLPAQPSLDRIRLRLALALTALTACALDDADAHSRDARDDARALGEPAFAAAALACGAVARVLAADPAGPDALAESSAALERLTPDELATRLPAFWMHGRALRALGRHDAALAALQRGLAIAADTGREPVVLMLTVESVAPLIELGRIADAVTAAEDGLELARLGANARTRLWATTALARARLAAGDVAAALRHARDAEALGTRPDVNAAGEPGWCLGAALVAAGNPGAAVGALRAGFGGPALPRVLPAERAVAAADLVEALVAAGDLAGAGERAGADRAVGTEFAQARLGLARCALLLAQGDALAAAELAAAARAAAAGAPLTAARAQLAEGRALAAAGERDAALRALREAEAALAAFGAARDRDAAIRELRRLGHRVTRPARAGDGPLTGREQEIAALVAAGRTNREVAEQLVLSPRTIEAHLRSIYGKLGVRSRVELARAVRPGED